MRALRLLLLAVGLALGLGSGERPRASAPVAADAVRSLAERTGEPAHPSASRRLAPTGLTARPPATGAAPDGRPAALPAPPAFLEASPDLRLSRLASWRWTRRPVPNHPPYFPTAPPHSSQALPTT